MFTFVAPTVHFSGLERAFGVKTCFSYNSMLREIDDEILEILPSLQAIAFPIRSAV